MKSLSKYFHIITFVLTSLLLTTIWFHGGYIIALGESAIPFYSLQNVFKVYGHVWTPISLGFYQTPVGSIPFFSYGLFFELLGLPGFAVQAIVFFTLNFLMLFNSYLLFTFLFRGINNFKKNTAYLFGSFFYLLNFISLVSVWNRMQYPFILFYVSLPLILYLYFKGIEQKKYIYSVYLGLLLIPFSMAFIAVPFMELFWGILGLYTFFIIVIKRNKQVTFFAITFLLLSGLIWLFLNSWWFLQYFQFVLKLALSNTVYSTSGNADTLKILSGLQGNLSYIFRLMNRDIFIKMESVWGSYYFTPVFILISYIIPLLAFFPIFIKKKPVFIHFFMLVALIVIFLTKGSAGPFGNIFLFLFTHVKFLEVFRGAFEKFGLVLPVAYAPLIVFSILSIISWTKERINPKKLYIGLIVLFICIFVILEFPFWNGWIFTYYIPHANEINTGDYIKVPNFYKDANNYLNNDPTDFRTILLPIENDSVTYNWNGHGYTGLDYTNGLFAKSFVSLSFGVENLDSVINQFQDIVSNAPQFFTTAMNMVNAKYLMIRKDIDYKYRATMNPDKEQQLIDKSNIPNLIFDKQFGKLFFYKNTNYQSKTYAANNLYGSDQNGLWRDIFDLTNFKTNDIILDKGIGQKQDKFIEKSISSSLIYPDSTINFSDYPVAHYADGLHLMPLYYRFLPGNKLYQLVLLKDKLQIFLSEDQQSKFFALLNLTAKRLGEFHRLVLDKNIFNAKLAQHEYALSLNEFKMFVSSNRLVLRTNIQYVRYVMAAEKAVLNHLLNTNENSDIDILVSREESDLQNISIAIGLLPHYSSLFKSTEKTIVYSYNLENDHTYKLELRYDDLSKWYDVDLSSMQIQVNDKLFTISPTLKNGFLNFGNFTLKKGINEIQIAIPQAKNLTLDTQGEVKTIAGTNKIITMTNFDRLAQYKMNFEYKVNRPSDLIVRTNSDIDYIANNKRDTSGSLGLDSYGARNWTHFTFPFQFNRGSSSVSLSFLVYPIKTCPNNDGTIPLYFNHCVEKKNTQTIDFRYRNLSVEREFNNQLLLVRKNANPLVLGKPAVTYREVNPAKYEVTIKNATKPFILVFSENFDPGWRAQFINTGTMVSSDNHFLADSYANAWYITKKGSYKIILSYASEDLYSIGKVISAVSIFIGVVFIFYFKCKK